MTTLEQQATAWMDQANCIGANPDLFFLDRGDAGGGHHSDAQVAKAICYQCPVRQECLDYAMSLTITRHHGIWGGTTPRERRTIRRQRAMGMTA